jgi:hypothetical protein
MVEHQERVDARPRRLADAAAKLDPCAAEVGIESMMR